MQDITRSSIAALVTADGTEPKVTIYAPMHKTATPPHMTENQIRFKNLIHQAAEELKTRYHNQEMAALLCSQLDKYQDDQSFWETQTEGLLLCASPSKVELFHLPVDTEEYLAIDTCYHLAPILALLNDEQSFYVLTVTQHQPRLFKGSGQMSLAEVEAGMPNSLAESLNLDETNQRNDHASINENGSGYNGRGGRRDPRTAERLRFFRLLDEITVNATERRLPLILAGTDSETAEFRSISKHATILPATITGGFSDAKAHDLAEPAARLIESELIATRHQQVIEAYDRLKGSPTTRATDDPLAIAEAATQGRIDTLLVALRRNTTDTIRDTARHVERITFPRAELSALINKAANAVVNTSGKVVNLNIGAIPGKMPMVALLRY